MIAPLPETPAEHFARVDYGDSELLVFRYDARGQTLVVCLNDLSQKIPEWVARERRTDYAFRYRIFHFGGVAALARSEIDSSRYAGAPNDYLTERDSPVVLVLETSAQERGSGFAVDLAFERGFGRARFVCPQARLYEVVVYAVRVGDREVYSVDAARPVPFDAQAFVRELHAGAHLPAL